MIAQSKETGYVFKRNRPISQYDYLGLLFGFITDLFKQNHPIQPLKTQTVTKSEGCSEAGLIEAGNKDKISCEQYVNNAMMSNKTIDMINFLRQSDCELPPIACTCCIGECAGAGG